MSNDKPKPAMQLILDTLKQNPRASYAEVKAVATRKGYRVYPIMYGRAQAMLRIVPVRPRGQGKSRAKKGDRGRLGEGALEGLLSAVRNSESERQRYRRALERIRDLLRAL